VIPRLLALCLLLALAGCSVGRPTSTPTPPGPSATQPGTTPTSPPAAATSYPGWPPETTYELIPIPVSSELVVGPNRFLLNLVDQTNGSLVAEDRAVELRFYDLATDPAAPAVTADATYLPILPPSVALYRANVDFEQAGAWGLETITTEPDGSHRTGRMIFDVRREGTTPPLGAQAPAVNTPTAASAAEIAVISTDTEPDPDFYRVSVADALAASQPFLVIFATPAFCTSRTCGPALDLVKEVAPDFVDRVDFIHVEPYELKQDGGTAQLVLSDENLPIPVEAVEAFGLPTEPYIFVVDSAGRITAKLEGVASAEEIRAALEEVAP
jgi:hypothetical protein